MFRVTALAAAFCSLIGCASQPQPEIQWTHANYDANALNVDNLACEARGYEVAGPLPQRQPLPNCSGGFACGYEKGATGRSNRETRTTWESAFTAGYRSCMYEKGYTILAAGSAESVSQ